MSLDRFLEEGFATYQSGPEHPFDQSLDLGKRSRLTPRCQER
jgi:hypothetical protein